MMRYILIPRTLVEDTKISPAAFRLYCLLVAEAGESGEVQISQSDLAEKLKCSRTHVNNLLKELRDAGIVGVDPLPGCACQYRLLGPRNERSEVTAPTSVDVPTHSSFGRNDKPTTPQLMKLQLMKLAELLRDTIREIAPSAGVPQDERGLMVWAEELRRMIILDGRPLGEVEMVIRELVDEPFYRMKVRDPRSLRQYYKDIKEALEERIYAITYSPCDDDTLLEAWEFR
jgi:hypothetical protein